MKIAIVVSEFNATITQGLLAGARKELVQRGVSPDNIVTFDAPGAYEIPLIAQKLARTGQYDGIVCLGAVIKGDTMHFEFISLGTTMGIQQAMLNTGVPIAFGVLTTMSEEQAEARSKEDSQNKGREAAAACWKTIRVLEGI